MHKLFLVLVLAPLAVSGQLDHAREVTKTLCSPGFHGRGYVNGGDSIAAEFIQREFKAAGCSFFKQGAFQPFSFNVNTFPGNMSVSVNSTALVPGIDYIVDPSSTGGKIAHRKIYKLPVSAMLDRKSMEKELKMLAAQKKSGNIPAVLICTTGLKGDSLKTANRLLVELTADYTVIEATDAKFTWSVSDKQYEHPLIHIQQRVLDGAQDELFIDYDINAKMIAHQARNVIAYAPAKKRSKKYIVFTAHYDHLGRMGRETYFPGGNDNASGTAMLLELARYFVEHPMDVNVVFMSFAGEEAGLIGSHYYVEHPLFPLENIQFLTNVDIMGSGEEGITVVNATVFPKTFEVLQEINKKKAYLVKIGSRGKAANSDHYFFTEAGVPAFFIYTMGPNKHYHDVLDTYEELSFSEFGDIYHLLIDFAGNIPKVAQ
jgi:aminopeptidase YwaD